MQRANLRLLLYAVLLLLCRAAVAKPDVTEPQPENGASVYLHQAEELRSARKCREAMAVYQAAERALDGRDSALAWKVHLGLASCSLSLGNHDDAAARIPLLLNFAGTDTARLTRTARFEAALLHRQGKLQDAEQASLRAVEFAAGSDDPVLDIDANSMLATVYSLQGRNREAMDIDERLLRIERELDRGAKPLAIALNELAIDYRRFGRFDEGLALLREALVLYRSVDDAEGQAMVLYNTAQVYADNGDSEGAFIMYREALNFAEIVGSSYGLGLLHTELGGMLAKAGNTDSGRTHFERSLDINRAAKQAFGELLALMGLGYLERQDKNLQASQQHLELAVSLADERGFGGVQAFARIELALTLAESGDSSQGLKLLDKARELGEAQDDIRILFDAAAARAKVLEIAGNRPQAAAQYLLALDMLESWRGRMALGDLLVSVPERYWHVYEGAIRVLAGENRDWDAFVVSERARARMLLDVLATRNLGPNNSSSDSLRLQKDLMAIGAALETADGTQRPALEHDAAALSAELQRQDEERRAANAAEAAITFPMSVSVENIRESALQPGDILLSYFWGEDDVFAWRIDSSTIRLVNLGPAKPREQQLDFLRAAVGQRAASIDWRPAAALAFQNLVAPLVDDSVEMAIVVADGPLLSLPLEVFLPQTDGMPFGALVPVVYVPSATVLTALAARSNRSEPKSSVLALGYSPERGDEYTPLPLAAKEAGEVYALYRNDGATLLADRDATLDAWIAAKPENYQILHFATHAIIDERHPEKSHLVFAESRLDRTAIRQLKFNAQLVTLSACSTAVGRHWRGEGMVGLAHAFLESGSQSLLASTWPVEDRYTAEFMREFYVNLESGDSPVNSLLQVRRDWSQRAGGYSHPGNWGGFVIIGWPW